MSGSEVKQLREAAGLTLAVLAARSGYSVATINGLELNDQGSKRLRKKLSDLLSGRSSSFTETVDWKARALSAERQLESLKTKLRHLAAE